MIIATGGQGEPRAALARIAFEQHKLKLDRGDLVVFSSKQIPGNEIAIGRIQNELAGQGHRHDHRPPGARSTSPAIRAGPSWRRCTTGSGREIIVPVHGEMRHMMEHARFARARGIPHGIVQKNGDLIRLAPDGPKKLGEERVGRLVLDGDVILPADGTTMNERRKIAFGGLISVAVPLDVDDRLAGDVEIDIQGIPVEEDRDAFLVDACDAAAAALGKSAGNEEQMREDVRLAVRRFATEWTGKKPVVSVLFVRV